MLMLIAAMWKAPRKPPLIVAIPAIVAMIGSVIISQTRALWAGVLIALAAGWILNLVKREAGVGFGKKFALSIIAAILVLALALMAISSVGILTVEDVAERTASETGNYLMDPAILSRLVSWYNVIGAVKGPGILFGNGFGASLTYFNLDFGMIRTVTWVDGSFFQTYLTMGLLGCIVLLLLFLTMIIRAARLFLRSEDRRRSAAVLGLFMALTAILTASITGSPITNYRFTVIWAVLIAMIQTEYNEDRSAADRVREIPEASPLSG
jgi:hypothetical protein